jgi:hypothetical protein
MLDNLFWVFLLALSVPKCTFPAPNSIEFGAGKVHFWFGSAECRGLAVLLRTWREEPARLRDLPLRISFFSHFSATLATVSRQVRPFGLL